MSDAGRILLLAILLLGMAGCQTPSGPRHPLVTVTVPETMTIASPAPLLSPAPVMAVPMATSPPPALVIRSAWPTNWVTGWIPLESWSKYNRLEKPIQVAPSTNPLYQLRTTSGMMAIKVGSRSAHCDGLECWLGYAPQLIKGIPYIHALDAQKNLQALMTLANHRFNQEGTIVIDAGHGGRDGGTRSIVNGEFEKQYTLDWALRLYRLLATNGWRVVLTRTNDQDISLAERVGVAERVNADLFLSLHFNSGVANRELAGMETYCLTPVGLPSSLVRDYGDDLSQVYPNNSFDEQNFQMAYRVHRVLVQATGAADRGVRRARFMGVLRGQNRPAVLIEAGYLSNPAEARKIALPSYRQTLAQAVAQALGVGARPE